MVAGVRGSCGRCQEKNPARGSLSQFFASKNSRGILGVS